MNGIASEIRQALGATLEQESQVAVMAKIPQFAQAEVYTLPGVAPVTPDRAMTLVFNMERGVHLAEISDFLRHSPEAARCDIILANELDDGCLRSGGKDTARELAQSLGFHYVFGLEFIELAVEADTKGYHGNAIFSHWPIRRAAVLRLPEQYNWYFDRQRRIGGRCAVFAELDVAGKAIGVVSIHLENRTNGEGRRIQMDAILEEAERQFPGMPVILGGDLNTNTFDGRDKEDIGEIAASPAARRRCLEEVDVHEPLLPAAANRGYRFLPAKAVVTRRKPLLDGGYLPLRLDWLLLRDITAEKSGMLSTQKEAFSFAPAASALAGFSGTELSDHNAVWASCPLA